MPTRANVPAPPLTPPVIGLLASITPEKTPNNDWARPESVIAYEPEGCNQEGAPFDLCDPAMAAFPGGDDTEIVMWKPYGIEVSDKCSTYGNDLDEGPIRRLLIADTERQLGAEFWDGALAQSSSLVDGDDWPNTWLSNPDTMDDLTEDIAVTLSHGMSCLDGYLASHNSGAQGAIHVNVQTLSQWVTLRIAEFVEGKWYSPGGNLIIASPGYSGNSPLGVTSDGNIWAYATDMPRIFLTKPQVFPLKSSTDRRTNTTYAKAQRVGLVEWQKCRHAGVRLDMDVCDTGVS